MEFFQILGDMSGLGNAGGVFMIYLFLVFAFGCIIANLGLCFTFKKAGQSGIAAFIPIYNQYILCKITGINTMWVLIYYVSFFIPVIGTIVALYFKILICFSVVKSFDKSEIYGIGLFLFGPIFYLIIGLDSSTYGGPNPMTDFIFKNKQNSNGNFNSQEYQNSPVEPIVTYNNYCINCGVQLSEGVSYCHNCGRRL